MPDPPREPEAGARPAMIRPATIDDLDAVVLVLAQALADDPLIDTLVRPDKGRPDAIARLMREVARRYYLDQGASHVALAGSNVVGVVLALPPEARTGYGLRDSMRMVRHTIRVARLRGLWRAGQASGFLNYIHPRSAAPLLVPTWGRPQRARGDRPGPAGGGHGSCRWGGPARLRRELTARAPGAVRGARLHAGSGRDVAGGCVVGAALAAAAAVAGASAPAAARRRLFRGSGLRRVVSVHLTLTPSFRQNDQASLSVP